ncbi:MAG: hypothetical protein Tp1100SUR763771_24 [Prokaryotic dsDNA virus sp.]|nr:MAG: hypothetical protein Tp1100SUR763771_24 [Prokaryotic dsDNA virus sp.]|tara:strand:- start:767 stop:1318 length:552 start_codon:yes stop_codon:yes gene_type:complete
MPRTLSSDLQTEVSNESTQIAFLIKLHTGTVIRLTNWAYDLTYNSESYEAGGSLISVDQISEKGKLEVESMSISFSNVSDQVRSQVQNGDFTDIKVEVLLGFLNSSNSFVGAINYFTGFIDTVSIKENIDNSILQLNVSTQWSNWSLKKGRYYTDESQQNFSSGDLGLQFATEVKPNLKWGKA